MDLLERISKNILNFEKELGSRPDVIFIAKSFFNSMMLAAPNTYLEYNNLKQTVFGLSLYIVHDHDLGGLDFQCFKSSHLNALGDRYKKDPRYSDYSIKVKVPRFASWDVSHISNGSPAPSIGDAATFKNVTITAHNAVLKRWYSFAINKDRY